MTLHNSKKLLTDARVLIKYPLHVFGALAQLGERMAGSHEVRGSIPLGSTINFSHLRVAFWLIGQKVCPDKGR